jgi:hypothetical protein
MNYSYARRVGFFGSVCFKIFSPVIAKNFLLLFNKILISLQIYFLLLNFTK